ncbi:MAG: nucleoside-triphosphatase [Clostridiales Family XIII bacterium]|jgi:nucleoside-triphosphatase|nr:nucleoside-triphosphatase [Clostridiales Family XIII bacterium]
MRGEKIFLTGERNVGKTTAIDRFIADAGIAPGGFSTVARDLSTDANEDRIYIVPYGDELSEQVNIPPVASRNKQNMTFTAYPDVFDTHGARILRESRGAELIVMDELGFMESEALVFQKEVFRLLDTDRPVLGVVKARHTPFLDDVRSHVAVTVLEVTKGNRDSIPDLLARLFRHST